MHFNWNVFYKWFALVFFNNTHMMYTPANRFALEHTGSPRRHIFCAFICAERIPLRFSRLWRPTTITASPIEHTSGVCHECVPHVCVGVCAHRSSGRENDTHTERPRDRQTAAFGKSGHPTRRLAFRMIHFLEYDRSTRCYQMKMWLHIVLVLAQTHSLRIRACVRVCGKRQRTIRSRTRELLARENLLEKHARVRAASRTVPANKTAGLWLSAHSTSIASKQWTHHARTHAQQTHKTGARIFISLSQTIEIPPTPSLVARPLASSRPSVRNQ